MPISRFRLRAILAVLGIGCAGGIAALGLSQQDRAAAAQQVQPGTLHAGGQLASFKSDTDLLAFLKRRLALKQSRNIALPNVQYAPPAPVAAEAAAQAEPESDAKTSDRITNTQESDVDEGGIVKKRGDLLVILRRGRLFTVSTAGGQMRPVDHINAFPPGITGGGDWYDEMLISGDRVIVIGYSYARGGTEVNRFRLSPDGHLRFEDAYHLRSNDYYSSRNYASRLIGNRLVYYTPLYLGWDQDPFAGFPAVSRWQQGSKPVFKRVARARDVYIVPSQRDDDEAELDTLHSVMDCDLTAPVMDCKATAVLGPASRTFYVSSTAVYLWVSDAGERGAEHSWLYRLPLDGTEKPSAIGTQGHPTDQFSFREDRRLGLIDVLVRSNGVGDWMWNSENGGLNQNQVGDVALLSVPIGSMGDGSRDAPQSRYRLLTPAGFDEWNFQNRFVGNHILYGGHGFQGGQGSTLYAVGLRGGPIAEIALPHAVERLDIMGEDGVVIGNDPRGGLSFTAVDLRRPMARLGSSFTFPAASQGENRSQAFFFRPDSPDGANGLLGLPITTPLQSQYARFLGSGSAILFLKRRNRLLDLAGRLDADPRGAADDACVASCVDWYGNARPIFIGNRVFALMGYELVEGRQGRDGAIGEVARLNFQPSARERPRG